ncbi:MAG: zinc-binding dehydrogenase [Actinobacteria bacterium]|nr:zinc-binding dehydrogenase [Actinomycetota bacterium]
MRAVRLHLAAAGLEAQVEEVPVPEPGPAEVLVRVCASGVNRIDLLTRDGQARPPALPHVPGSEVAGEVVAVGAGCGNWGSGDRVVVDPVVTCGECELCRRGRGNLCARSLIYGVQTAGGYADFAVAPVGQLVGIPDGVSFEAAASVTAAGATAWQMLCGRADLRVGETVLVIAAGSGLGTMAIQMAALAGADVLATAGSAAKREHALRLGARAAVDHRQPGWSSEVRELTAARGADLVLEHVGAATWDESMRALSRAGRLVTCGGHSGFEVGLDLWRFFVKGQTIIGSFAATRQDLVDVLDLLAAGKVRPVVHEVFPLAEFAAAQALLDDREAVGKVLLKP